MPRLFLIRHGEPVTAWGGADPDPGLSDLGRRQAEQASAILATKGGLEVISSPMRRCRETAEPYAASVGMTPVTEVGVSEIATPPGVQDRRAWLGENFPWQSPTGRRIWPDLDPAVRQWRDRVLQTVRAIESDAAIFSHFIAINAIVGAALNRPETIVFRPGYASVTEIEVDGDDLRLVGLGSEQGVGEVR